MPGGRRWCSCAAPRPACTRRRTSAPRWLRRSASSSRATRSTGRRCWPPARRAGVIRKPWRTFGFAWQRVNIRRGSPRSGTRQRRQELQRERVAIDAELRQLEGRLQFLGEQQQQLRTQLEAWSIRQSTLTDELERRRGNVETADRELRDVDARAAIIEEGVGEADAGLDVARKAVVEHEAQLKAVEAELVALRTLLDHAHRRGPIKRGDNWERLLELIEVDPVNRAAVEAAL